MVLNSFLGILTLQIGVAVLSALFIVLAFLVAITNFLDEPMQSPDHFKTIPVNYIVLAIFTILLLLAGIAMFSAAYTESLSTCMLSLILVFVIFIFFVITSIISFSNISSMVEHVCVSRSHCPETLWLSGLNYRSLTKIHKGTDVDETVNNSTESSNSTKSGNSTGTTMPLGPDDDEKDPFSHRRMKWRGKKPRILITTRMPPVVYEIEKPLVVNESVMPLVVTESVMPLVVNESVMPLVVNESVMPFVVDEQKKPVELIKFPLGTVPSNTSTQNSKGILKFVKRSISSIINYVKGDPHLMKHKSSKWTRSDDEKDYQDYNYEDEKVTENVEMKYIFGYDFIVSVILFVIFIIFFIFTMIVVWSYRKQLKYIMLYHENPASKHYLF